VHRAKFSRKETCITDWEHDVLRARYEKDRASRETGVAVRNQVDVQAQHDRELKARKGGKVIVCGWRREPIEEAVDNLCTQAEIMEGTIKDEGAAHLGMNEKVFGGK
jgi:hypothetical protein